MSSLIPTRRLDLRDFTLARVSLPTTGHSIATSEVLNFQLAHAQARDAVHALFNLSAFAQRFHTELPILAEASIPVLQLHTNAPDRATYLRQPILGRTLHPDSVARLQPTSSDLAISRLWRSNAMPFPCLHTFCRSFSVPAGPSPHSLWCNKAGWPLATPSVCISGPALASSLSANAPASPRPTVSEPTSPGILTLIALTPTATACPTSAAAASLRNPRGTVSCGISRLPARGKSPALRLRRGPSNLKPLTHSPETP